MSRTAIWCLVVSLGLGCQSGEEPVRGADPGVERLHYAPTPKPEPQPVDAPRPEPPVDVLEPGEEPEEEAERDLAEELKAALGTPLQCLGDFTAPEPTEVRISVSATVRPTGMVMMPSVYGSGISNDARQCIERRVTTVVLASLDEPVSQRVSTVLELEYTPPVIVESEPGVPEPRLRNVRDPLPPRREVAPSGRPIQEPTSRWISGGFEGGRPIQEPTSRKVSGPKPRAIDGYDVDENAQEWTR